MSRVRLRLAVRGVVQGVGFRPYIYRLATELGLTGWVLNNPQGVRIEVEGEREHVEAFLMRLEPEKPAPAFVQSVEPTWLDPVGYDIFVIRESQQTGEKRAFILPDLATCADCLRELFDPANRRFRYPFINCTYCGPRFSIILTLPYDRPNTTMRQFTLCPECRREYEDPTDRRFHAQPNACPVCGPHLAFWDSSGRVLAEREDALQGAVEAIRAGQLVAIKGIGGFLLLADACNEEAIQLLRARKHREEKPFALMYPDLERLRQDALVSELEARLLRSPQAPIVLLDRLTDDSLAPSVAPRHPSLGAMLPYAPLHHLLLAELNSPVVATSGNLSDEPICTDEQEALVRLKGIADVFLTHNRPIARHVDDSIVRVVMGREMTLRRARGYAPLPVTLEREVPTLLAVGAHLKNAVALSVGQEVLISQHIGDLETAEAYAAFQNVAQDMLRLYAARPEAVVCDLHPDYLSTRFAEQCGLPVRRVQHHKAHVFACMAENGLRGSALGVSWDGTGYGEDGTVWGGEFFRVAEGAIQRTAYLRPFPLPGGEQAVREPRRVALGLLYAVFGEAIFQRDDLASVRAFSPAERTTLRLALQRNLNTPLTTSIGRLFDGAASLADVRQVLRYEGQAAMEWENCAAENATADFYPFELRRSADQFVLDWEPMLRALLEDGSAEVLLGVRSARFHQGLVQAIVRVAAEVGESQVVLTGGCFLNRRLLTGAVQALTAAGFRPCWHQRVPPGDGGIALGQIASAWYLAGN
jgi:hydrogenase maturation protein HypF